MRIIYRGFRSACCASLLTLAGALSPNSAFAATAPVPPAIAAAKSIFVSNAGADSGLFPEPFSGDPSRPYNQFYAALKATGQFDLLSNPADADLVLELQLTAPYGPANPDKVNGTSEPLPMFRLVVFDRKTHYVLWALTESIERAFGQKNHDRKFDDALARILSDFQMIAGKVPVR